jgi:hypothetical protein
LQIADESDSQSEKSEEDNAIRFFEETCMVPNEFSANRIKSPVVGPYLSNTALRRKMMTITTVIQSKHVTL